MIDATNIIPNPDPPLCTVTSVGKASVPDHALLSILNEESKTPKYQRIAHRRRRPMTSTSSSTSISENTTLPMFRRNDHPDYDSSYLDQCNINALVMIAHRLAYERLQAYRIASMGAFSYIRSDTGVQDRSLPRGGVVYRTSGSDRRP
jgi:hypothetical protein